MKTSILRRLRGALGTSLVWAAAWAVTATSLVAVGFLLGGDRRDFGDTVRPVALLAGVSGFVAGAVYSLVLGAFYRHRQLADLSPLRMAAWGAATALLVPAGLIAIAMVRGVPLQPVAITGMVVGIGGLGAATGGGIVKLAQSGDRRIEG